MTSPDRVDLRKLPFICRHADPRCEDDPCPAGIAWLCNAPADHPLRNVSGKDRVDLREKVARVIDPEAWAFHDRHCVVAAMKHEIAHETRSSRAKADQILALIREPLPALPDPGGEAQP